MLNPGGKIVIANFMPTLTDAGYFEGVLDWWLIYRSPVQIERFVSNEYRKSSTVATTVDETNTLAYLTITLIE